MGSAILLAAKRLSVDIAGMPHEHMSFSWLHTGHVPGQAFLLQKNKKQKT